MNIENLKEAVAIFKTTGDMELAIDKLTSNGFNPAEISLLAEESKIKKKFGELKSIEELMDNPEAPRVGYVANENIGAAQGSLIGGLAYISSIAAAGVTIAVGGPLSAVFTSAAIAGGAFATIGAVIGSLIGKHHADHLEQQIDNGGIIVWVKIDSEEKMKQAIDILSEHNAECIHTHDYGREEIETENEELLLS